MNKKTLLTIAIIAALPFGAMAAETIIGTNTPAPVTNGTVTIAKASGPYVTATIGNDDDKHIASTAYVKGAYNDAIAAINTLNLNKQDTLHVTDYEDITGVLPAEYFLEDYFSDDDLPENAEKNLVTAAAVAAGIKSQRAEVWTTWDDDTAKTEVAFVTAQE